MQRALCIWLPAWPIQRIAVARRELSGKHEAQAAPFAEPPVKQHRQSADATPPPLVLHARDPRRGQRVVACCSRAHEFGVRIGQPVAEVTALQQNLQAIHKTHEEQTKARQISPRSSEIDLQEHEPELDIEALSKLAIWCEQFSPIVGIEDCDEEREPVPSSLLLDITGLAPIFDSEQRLIELIFQAFSKRGYQIRIGIGNTVGAAWAIAHYSHTHIVHNSPQREFLALPHLPNEPEGGTFDHHQPTATNELGPLPIEALRLPASTIDTLHQLGIETISQLLQLPRDGLATRLGEALIHRIDQTFGKQPEVIVAHRSAPDFEADFVFEHPTYRRNVIETVLQQLTADVTQLLAKNDHAAVQVEAELLGDKTTHKLFISLFQPTSNPQHINELLLLQLETSQMRERVQRVRLAAVTTVRIAGQQHVLWDEVGLGFARRDSELAQLVDRLSSRLGKECVFGIQAQAGALPEKAYRKKPLTETVKKTKRGSKQITLHKQATAETLRAPHRPLWLHEPPEPLRTQPMPRISLHRGSRQPTRNSPPTFFQFQNEQHQVAYHWGPERIETGWWSGKSIRRDYYRVETTTGHRFWLFRQLDNGAWFLHGCFL